MAGIHKYSSSLFIQSGSIAKFKSGITASSLNIEGSVTANKYLLSDGTEVIGGEQKVFFAGAPGDATLGISRSAANGGPESKDSFIGVDASNADPEDADKIAIGGIIIQTTGSSTFQPNFFNFIKLGDDPNIVNQGLAGSTINATTVQQGGLDKSSYTPTSDAERQTGVHRYIIFAAETGSGGETHQVFHTVTLDAFSNIPPTIVPPPITAVTLSMAHNENSGDLVLHFTKSFDQNQIDDGDTADYLTEFSVTRNSSNLEDANALTPNPILNSITDTSDAFSLSLNHDDNSSPAQSITITELNSPGLSSSAGAPKLHFTASVTNYTVDVSNFNTIFYSVTQNQNFDITLKDTNSTLALNRGITDQIISMAVVPPPTASISDIKVEFEGSDNNGGFTNIPATTHTHILLYDTVTTLDTPTISELDDRYTSSLVRMKVTADITPPLNFVGDDSYQTRIQIHEADSGVISEEDSDFKTFKFTRNHSTASHVENNLNNVSTNFDGELNASNTESNGFTSFEITPTFGEGVTTDQLFYGSSNEDFTSANRTDEVKHGDHDHFVVTDLPNASTLNIIKCPDILVKNPKVEIQKGSKYSVDDEGLSTVTNNLLYGLSSSLLSSQTQSHIIDALGTNGVNHPQLKNYITESIVKLRVLADIIEPFGPDHKEITATLTDNNTHTTTLNLHTGSDADVLLSNFGYTTNHGYSNNGIDFNGKELLVSSYTSSWVEFNFDQGSYTFTATFTRTDGVTNRTEITADNTITADLSLGGTPDTQIKNLNHQTETFGYSGILTQNATRDVLYGDSHVTNPTSESAVWQSHDLAPVYASHSVSQVKISGIVIEPFGPGRCSIGLSTPINNLDNFDSFAFISNNTFLAIQDDNREYNVENQLVTIFTSSFVPLTLTLDEANYGGSQIFIIGGPNSSTAFSYNGPLSFQSDDFEANNILDTNFPQVEAKLTVRDTQPTEITNIFYETEDYGYSYNPTTETTRKVLYGFPHFITADSSSFETHASKSEYSSCSIARFRVRAKITEPIGYLHTASRFEEVWDDPVDNETFTNVLHFETDSSIHQHDSSSGYDLRNRLTSSYTSSWVGRQLSSSINGSKIWAYISGSILHEPVGENKFTTESGPSTILTINDTAPTQISNIVYEVETFGHSNLPTTSTTRSVLYGDPHITNENSSSTNWFNHEHADAYASHSITRFRVKSKITEPLGPLHFSTTLIKQWSSSVENFASNSLSFHTSSEYLIISKSYDSQTRLVIEYTGSFDGIPLNATTNNARTYTHTGSISHEPEGENSVSLEAATLTSILIKDTPKTQVNITNIEIETFGESNIGQTNPIVDGVQNFTAISRSLVSGISETLTTGSGFEDIFTGSVVSRFRTLVNIVEPLGPLHHGTQLQPVFISEGLGSQLNGPSTIFTTNSLAQGIEGKFDDNESGMVIFGYNEHHQLTASYTSSFKGTSLLPTDTLVGAATTFYFGSLSHGGAVKTHNPDNENGADFNFPSPDYHTIKLQVSSSTADYNETQISNLKLEVETVSGSNVGTFERTVTIPHGNTATVIDSAINDLYPFGSSGSLVSVRVLGTIKEIPGPSHFPTTIKIGGHSDIKTITFVTNSSDIVNSEEPNFTTTPTAQVGKITNYTSSFFPIALSQSANTVTNTAPDNAGRFNFTVSASIIDYNSIADNFNIITSIQPSHSIIHVTGALSSSTAITINVNTSNNSNISSSVFADGENENFYYVYSSNLANSGNDTLKLFPTLVTTAPSITSESNLVFPNNLDIDYTINQTISRLGSFSTFTNDTSDSPSLGTASIFTEESILDDLTNVEKFTLTTLVTDFTHGNGTNSITTPIFVIPAQPKSLNNVDGTTSFKNHEDLGRSSGLYRATLPTGLVNYENSEGADAGDVVSNIFITSQSSGGTNNYSMSISLLGSYQGDYADTDRAFAFGDTGSLVVKINDTIVVNASLKDNFATSNKSGNQTLSGYNVGFSNGSASFNNSITTTYNNKGHLILDKIAPFNNVSQSIIASGPNNTTISYPNGYQAWNAHINVNEKLREGYNKVDFEHRIFPGVTHSITSVDWYYDDGLVNPVVDTSHLSCSFGELNSTSPTHSLSGISYFVKDIPFNISLNNVFLNLANKTYRDKNSNIAFARRENSTDSITISADDSEVFNNSLNFKLNHTVNDNGLEITPNISTIIPDITSTGSVVNIKVKGTGTISANAGLGETRNIQFGVFNRNNYANNNSWDDDKFEKSTGTYQIGRFMSDIGTDSTKTVEYFNRETFRLKSGSTSTNEVDIESLTVSEASFETLLTSNFKSTESIENTKELQQIIGGELIYPLQLNTAITFEPNLVDYNTANFNTYATTPANVRWYYRAFQFEEFKTENLPNFASTDFSSTTFNGQSKFKIKITYDGIASSEVSEQFSLTSHASNDEAGDILLEGGRKVNKIQIALRLPGPVSAGSSQQTNAPGTKWGIVNNSKISTGPPPNSDVFSMRDTNEDVVIDTSAKTITIPVIFRSSWRLFRTNGVILMRIVINKDWGKSTSDFTSPGWDSVSNSSPGVIKKIELLPN